MGFIQSAGILLGYYLLFLFIVPVLIRQTNILSRETSRKFQHFAFALSIFLLLELFADWFFALAAMGLLLLVAFPALFLMERTRWYHYVLVDRTASGGELRRQLLLVQLSYGTLITLFWGLGEGRLAYVAATAVMAWGLGDAAAALAGKRFGQLRYRHRFFSKKKSYEGFGAMVFWSGAGIMLTLWLYGGLSLTVAIFCAVFTSPVSAFVELASRKGFDTLTVPWATAAVLAIILFLFQTGGIPA